MIGLIVGAILASPLALAQGNGRGHSPTPADPSHVVLGIVPGDAREYLRNMGIRLTRPGKERITATGSWTTPSGASRHSLVRENPGKVRIDVTGAEKKSLSFDGAAAHGVAANIDKDILETLTDDAPEAFFFGFASGATYRFLGGRFRTDDGKNPAYTGPFYGIYQKLAPVLGGKDLSQKVYLFDASTGLLSKVRYASRPQGKTFIEVQYSNWTTVNGEQIPGKIVRTENGAAVFTLTYDTVTFGPSGDSAIFGNR